MKEIIDLLDRITAFQKRVNENTNLEIHRDNKFNKQFGVLHSDLGYIKILTWRIESALPDRSIEMTLDLKSLYVFGRVFCESLIYMCSLFVESSENINWKKIGPFIGSIQKYLDSEGEEFKKFWVANEKPIRNLYETFGYRNYVLHEKDSSTEWTFSNPGLSNLENVHIENIPWGKNDSDGKPAKTLNGKNILDIIKKQSFCVFDYLESTI